MLKEPFEIYPKQLNKSGGVPSKTLNRRQTGIKKSSDDVPDWAKGYRPTNGEDGKAFARRVCDENLGPGYSTGPTSPFNQIKKWADRDFQRTPLPKPQDNYNFPGSPFFDPVTYDPWAEPEMI